MHRKEGGDDKEILARYGVVERLYTCLKCGKKTEVVILKSEVEKLNLDELTEKYPFLYEDDYYALEERSLMNHCLYCKSKIEESSID